MQCIPAQWLFVEPPLQNCSAPRQTHFGCALVPPECPGWLEGQLHPTGTLIFPHKPQYIPCSSLTITLSTLTFMVWALCRRWPTWWLPSRVTQHQAPQEASQLRQRRAFKAAAEATHRRALHTNTTFSCPRTSGGCQREVLRRTHEGVPQARSMALLSPHRAADRAGASRAGQQHGRWQCRKRLTTFSISWCRGFTVCRGTRPTSWCSAGRCHGTATWARRRSTRGTRGCSSTTLTRTEGRRPLRGQETRNRNAAAALTRSLLPNTGSYWKDSSDDPESANPPKRHFYDLWGRDATLGGMASCNSLV